MKTLLIITIGLFFMGEPSDNIKPGNLHQEAIEEFGVPSFEYEKNVEEGHMKMKFNVTGWEKNNIWHGVQAINDTIQSIYTFKNKSEYIKYITKE